MVPERVSITDDTAEFFLSIGVLGEENVLRHDVCVDEGPLDYVLAPLTARGSIFPIITAGRRLETRNLNVIFVLFTLVVQPGPLLDGNDVGFGGGDLGINLFIDDFLDLLLGGHDQRRDCVI